MERQTPDSRGQEEHNPFYYEKSRKYTQGGANCICQSHESLFSPVAKACGLRRVEQLAQTKYQTTEDVTRYSMYMVNGLYSDN